MPTETLPHLRHRFPPASLFSSMLSRQLATAERFLRFIEPCTPNSFGKWLSAFVACFSAGTRNVRIRRVYVSQPKRGHSNSGPPDGYVFYACQNSLNENSIAEGLIGYGFTGWGNNNAVLGAVALNNGGGLFNGTATNTSDRGTNFFLGGYVGVRNGSCVYFRPTGNYSANNLHCVANQISVEPAGSATITDAVTVATASCYLKETTLFTPDEQKLWDSATGKMRFGPPIVPGVNDASTGLVRDTLGGRLNIKTPGCLPQGY